MPHLEPHAALVTCEQALRQLVEAVLLRRDGPDWLEKNFDEERRANWQLKQSAEERTRGRRGHARTSTNLLDFSELPELSLVIEKHWANGFSMAFGGVDRKEVLILLHRFEGLRLPIAHPRELLPFEEDLVSGIAGYVRNRVTIYLSSQDPAGEYWPRVESVTDSFGNTTSDPGKAVNVIQTGLTLRPGDVVTYTCRATDPQGRELVWYFERYARDAEPVSGADVEMRWEVTEADIGDSTSVHLLLKVKAASWHRLGLHHSDAQVSFTYRVLPPTP